jgi:hypothetical protein
MNITKKQRLLMAAILAIGLAAGGAVLTTDRRAPAAEEHGTATARGSSRRG